jgi:hypothetical protein
MPGLGGKAVFLHAGDLLWMMNQTVAEAIWRESEELNITPMDVIHAALVHWLANNPGRTKR